jgi:hypothetical protein
MIDIGILETAGRSVRLRRGFIDVAPALEQPDDLVAIEFAERMAGFYP